MKMIVLLCELSILRFSSTYLDLDYTREWGGNDLTGTGIVGDYGSVGDLCCSCGILKLRRTFDPMVSVYSEAVQQLSIMMGRFDLFCC